MLSVVGARPQFVKLAPVSRELFRRRIEHVVVHTGQHYDAEMSERVFSDFALDAPAYNLSIGSGSHAEQTGRIMIALEPVLDTICPDWVVVYGDTNSTVAAALAAVKLSLRVAHLESGLRSRNRSMPEEHNRVLTDHASDLLFAPTGSALSNLRAEGLGGRALLTGDVMADICLEVARQTQLTPPHAPWLPSEPFVLCTIHRPYNTDSPERLKRILHALSESPAPVLLPAHPRLRRSMTALGSSSFERGAIRLIDPLNYSELIHAVLQSQRVITDSGGLQKEAYILGVPCTTVRSETEWPETLENDWNVLCFSNLDALVEIAFRATPAKPGTPHFGTGHAASHVVDALTDSQKKDPA